MKMSLLMSGSGVWVQIEMLPIRLRVLLPMPMKDGLKAAADGTGIVPIKRKSMRIPS
jgi:hypothetical protein